VKKYPPLPSISCLSGSIEGRQERIWAAFADIKWCVWLILSIFLSIII
jgi:hypothetical protein